MASPYTPSAFLAASIQDNAGMERYRLDPARVRDISGDLLDEHGQLKVVPAAVLAATSAQERMLFGVRQGVYGLPTAELCDFLRRRIGARTAIEVGAGTGVLARALGIVATDNRQQEDAAILAHYRRLGQPTVPYGDHVVKLDAHSAVEWHRPQVVIACWVTHRFDPAAPDAGGSESGVDEAAIIASCEEYIFIGNEHVHRHKPILKLPHEKLTPTWLFSRAINGTRDFIGIWPGGRRSSSTGNDSRTPVRANR
jgi:hypothetical protein